jgi:hypothetical protein
MEMVHIEGMGVLGSMVAWELERAGVAFTWNDSERPFRHAWQASTGLIYPSGHGVEGQGYDDWRALHASPPWQGTLSDVTEIGSSWFTSKHVPHGAKDQLVADLGPIRMGVEPTIHVNVQQFVSGTRRAFEDRNAPAAKGDTRVVAHGYSYRLDHVVWGWSAGVELEIRPDILDLSNGRRPSFYLRTNRFTLRYALPRAGTRHYYAGSLMIVQKQPRLLDASKHLDRWAEFVAEVTNGMVRLARIVEGPMQGWRPSPSKADLARYGGQPLPLEQDGERIVCPPLGLSGVRFSPLIARAVADRVTALVVR